MKETSSEESATDSTTFLIINILVLVIVIILLISLFLAKRSKIKKERMKNLKTKAPTVMLRRESLSPTHTSMVEGTSYYPGVGPGLDSDLPIKSVPQQEPMPKLPPYQMQTQKPTQKPKYNTGDSELIQNNDLTHQEGGGKQ